MYDPYLVRLKRQRRKLILDTLLYVGCWSLIATFLVYAVSTLLWFWIII